MTYTYSPVKDNAPVIWINSDGREHKCFKCKGTGVDPDVNNWCTDCAGAGTLKTNRLSGSAIICKYCGYKMPIVRYEEGKETDDAMGFPTHQEVAIFKCPNCDQEWRY